MNTGSKSASRTELFKNKRLIGLAVLLLAVLVIAAIVSWKVFAVLAALFCIAMVILLMQLGKMCSGPFVNLGMKRVIRDFQKKYGGRPAGEIVFYGASNFTFWKTLEEDMKPWHTQNHGFGGSTDALMKQYAPEMLYPYKPSLVFIQTGSNDNASGLPLEQIMENKRALYAEYRKNLPDAKFIIMSGLPLPGREQYLESILGLNAYLKTYLEGLDGFYFIDATDAMMKDGKTRPEYFNRDGIHLNAAGHAAWTKLMRAKLEELGVPHGEN